jgi:hypothetical protein
MADAFAFFAHKDHALGGGDVLGRMPCRELRECWQSRFAPVYRISRQGPRVPRCQRCRREALPPPRAFVWGSVTFIVSARVAAWSGVEFSGRRAAGSTGGLQRQFLNVLFAPIFIPFAGRYGENESLAQANSGNRKNSVLTFCTSWVELLSGR